MMVMMMIPSFQYSRPGKACKLQPLNLTLNMTLTSAVENLVTVQTSSATRDLTLIQQNKFY